MRYHSVYSWWLNMFCCFFSDCGMSRVDMCSGDELSADAFQCVTGIIFLLSDLISWLIGSTAWACGYQGYQVWTADKYKLHVISLILEGVARNSAQSIYTVNEKKYRLISLLKDKLVAISWLGGGGGTRYILGWGGAAGFLIPWPCLRQNRWFSHPV